MPTTPTTKLLPEFTMLTMLVQLMVILRNKNGDATMHDYVDRAEEPPMTVPPESDFSPLDAFSAIFVRDQEVIAACHRDMDQRNLFLVDENRFPSYSLMDYHDEDHETPESTILGFTGIMKRKVQLRGLDIVAMPNPGDDVHDITHVPAGKDFWPLIRDSQQPVDWMTGVGSLADHTRTVESYLNDYMKYEKQRYFFATKFNYYLIIACWKKMYRRIKAWTALGFLHNLYHCGSSGQVKTWISLFNWKKTPRPLVKLGPGDSTLVRYLTETTGLEEEMITDAVNKESLKDFLNHVRGSVKNKRSIYNQKTALGFHELLVVALIHLGLGLGKMHRSFDKRLDDTRTFVSAVLKTETFAQLVFYIFSSSAFEIHMRVCTDNGAAISQLAGIYSHRKSYRAFAKRLGILEAVEAEPKSTQRHEGTSAPVLWEDNKNTARLDEPDEPDANAESDEPDDNAESAGEGARPIFDIVEADKLEAHSGSEPSLHAFTSWVKTFVFHFFGKRALEEHCRKLMVGDPSAKVQVTLLATNRTEYIVPSWTKFIEVIKRADGSVEGSKPITGLDDFLMRLPAMIEKAPAHGFTANVIGRFMQIVQDKLRTMKVGPHCEAIFLLLALYPDLDENVVKRPDGTISNVCKKLLRSPISVSKLCCPACWELLKAFRTLIPQGLGKLAVRGHHHILYHVALPKGVPSHITAHMEKNFQALLCQEIRKLLEEERARAKGSFHRSTQSGSSIITIVSSIEGDPENRLLSNTWRNTFRSMPFSK